MMMLTPCRFSVDVIHGRGFGGPIARTLWPLACVSALSLSCWSFSEDRLVADFENPAQETVFTATGRATCSLSTERSSRGKRSLRMTFERYERGMPQWPSCGFELQALGAPRDWREFNELLIDLYIESADDVLVKMVLTSAPEGRWVGPRNVAPGKWTTIRLPLWLAGPGLNPRAMEKISLVLTRPPHPAVIYMDNLRLSVLDLSDPRSVEWFLTSPSYHQGFFHSKPEHQITARWECRTTLHALRKGALRFTVERHDGTRIDSKEISGAELVKAGKVSFAKPEMRDGETVALKMEAVRGGKLLWSKRIAVQQYARGSREITLRNDGVTLVDGKPFFPLGMYSVPPSEFASLRKMGFNSAHSYSPANAAYMKAAEEAGLFVLPRLRGKTRQGRRIYHDPTLDGAVALKYINQIKHSPALLGYYLFDEPNPGNCPREKLLALCDFVRQADPYHLAAGCNNSFQTAYYRVSDAMMVDNYPIPGPMDGLIRDMRDGAAAQSPSYGLWFVPQAFNYETHFTTTLEKRRHGFRRPPTFDEIRTMPWLAIALGARGLFYYSFQTQGFYLRDAFPWFWRGFEHHVREVVALLPWLVEREPEQPPSCDNANVFVTTRRRGRDWFIVAANAALEPQKANVTVPGLGDRALHVVSEKRSVNVRNGVFQTAFGALETHLYLTSLDLATAALPKLDEIRAEVKRLEAEFWRINPSVFTYRDGARLHASWGFPDPEKVSRKIWYRMIDGYPGTQWVVGNKYKARIQGWSKKDFVSAGRWIEVRGREMKRINRIRAIVTPGVAFDVQVWQRGRWRTVESETVPDAPPRHCRYASATTTSHFDTIGADRFRIVFRKPAKKKEVVFELSAWKAEDTE